MVVEAQRAVADRKPALDSGAGVDRLRTRGAPGVGPSAPYGAGVGLAGDDGLRGPERQARPAERGERRPFRDDRGGRAAHLPGGLPRGCLVVRGPPRQHAPTDLPRRQSRLDRGRPLLPGREGRFVLVDDRLADRPRLLVLARHEANRRQPVLAARDVRQPPGPLLPRGVPPEDTLGRALGRHPRHLGRRRRVVLERLGRPPFGGGPGEAEGPPRGGPRDRARHTLRREETGRERPEAP